MGKDDVLIIKKTWRLLKDIDSKIIGDVFYSKLFIDYPFLRKMFGNDMDGQYKKLVDMLNFIVMNINDLDKLTNTLVAMADRHVGYGVKPDHYKKVGEALIYTLKKGLGNDWNSEAENAWINCYTLISDTMIGVEAS